MALDYFIPTNLTQDYQQLQKARILVAILFIYIGIFLFTLLWINFAPSVDPVGAKYGSSLCAVMVACYCASLALLRYTSALKAISHFVIAATATSIFTGVLLSGGPIEAPATIMILLPIIMAFVLIDKNNGLLWTTLIMTTHIILVLMHISGFRFLQLLPESIIAFEYLIHWLIAYTAIIGLMYFSFSINDKLRKELDAKQQRYEYLASHDVLTHLANRLQFDQNLDKAISRSRRNNRMFALFIIDLDKFKPINDNLGHDAGDKVLQEVGRRLRKTVRDIDTVARLGGDEFGILLEDIHDVAHIAPIAEKVREALIKPMDHIETQPMVGCSIGITIYPNDSTVKANLLKYADLAMYCAKQQRNSWKFYAEAECNE